MIDWHLPIWGRTRRDSSPTGLDGIVCPSKAVLGQILTASSLFSSGKCRKRELTIFCLRFVSEGGQVEVGTGKGVGTERDRPGR